MIENIVSKILVIIICKVESLEDETIRLPAIAHVTTKQGLLHFVVIYKLAKRKVQTIFFWQKDNRPFGIKH